MLNANTIVGGRYKVVKPIGGGGMKLVYLAEDLRLASRRCALAEMVDSFTNPDMQRQAAAAFHREADMLAQLSNEHIPRIFDRFSEQNHHYLVMEYVDGITLEQALAQAGGKLHEASVVDVALQILDTLIYLHGLSQPVVYRDLKPSNVMMMANGQVKLIDFGIARLFQPHSSATMIGTQGYAPPEQYRGKVETRSDLYALGATMHHSLSGRDPTAEPPFSFPPLATAAPNITPALAELVDQALAYDVDRRIPRASEFKRRLIEIKSGVASAAAPSIGRPQPGPLSSGAPSPASAPTMLGEPIEIPCPGCGRHVPPDSKFCSFCAADMRRVVLGPGQIVGDSAAETVVLPEEPAPLPRRPRHGIRRHKPATIIRVGLLAALVLAGYQAVSRLVSSTASNPAPPYPAASEPGPAPVEPRHSDAREIQLRQWLNQMGYRQVHFRIDGDTIVLWGTVPRPFDREAVQVMASAVTGLLSVEDHLSVQNDEFGFGEP
jgi:serine/threonine protein kinase